MKKILFILAILLAAPVLRAADDEIFDPPTPPDPGAAYVVNLESSIPEAALLDGSGAYRKGEYVTITCQPHEGFRFQQWIANGETLSTFPTYTFQMPDHSLNIVAKMVQLTKQTLTINTNIEGAAITTGAGDYYPGDAVAIHCTTHEDYVFLYWALGNDVYSYDQDITFTMGETPQVLTAVCKHVPVGIISVRSDDEQAGQVSSLGGIYLVGTELKYYATPLDGYTFSHWEIDGEHYSDTDTILYTVTDQNVEIRAFFDFSPDTPDDPALELTSIIHIVSEPLNAATFNLQSGNHYMEGDTLFISAQLQDNYRLDGWYINGQCVSTTADLIYVVGRKDETIVLRATELKIQTLVLVSMPENAVTFNLPAYSNVRATDNVTIQATVDADYLFDGWYENNELISNTLTIQYQMPNRVATLIAKAHPINDSDEFDPAPPSEPDLETALISAYPNSAIMGQVTGAATHVIGDTITLQATPLHGYYFVNWSDGHVYPTRTIIVEEDITLIANFAPHTFSIQATANDPKMGQVTGAGTYPYHSYPTLRAIPYEEYEFVKWSDGSIFDEYTIHVVSDTILTAIFQQKEYLLDISSSNDQAGQVIGAGKYHRGDTVSITAVPNQGYNFVQWSDGDTATTKTIIIDGAMSFVAHFAAEMYTIQASSNDENMGWVIGAGVYAYDSHPMLKAIAKPGYELQAWSNGVTDTEYTLHLTSDTTLVANFQIKRYNVDITSSNDVAGQVTGTGIYSHGDTITITATANYGYEFIKWSDGNTDATRTITVEANLALVAHFAPALFSITLSADNAEMGQVTGAGEYPYLTELTITATANYGYEFIKWSDGSTDATRTITVEANTALVAEFAPALFTINLSAENAEMGQVTGAGEYPYLTELTITATPNYGYEFIKWSDGNTDATRTITVEVDTVLVAEFAPALFTIQATAIDETMGQVTGAGTYPYNSYQTLIAIPNEGYEFVKWSDGHRFEQYTLLVQRDTALVAYFQIKQYYLKVASEDTQKGIVSGSGIFNHGETVTVSAKPRDGYVFYQWSNGVQDNPYTFVIIENTTLTAQFIEGTQSNVEHTPADKTNDTQKIMRNGQLIIIHKGKQYNAFGHAL